MNIILLSVLLLFLVALAQGEETLTVYHKKGNDFLRRGTIDGLPLAPKYTADPHGQGDLAPGLYQVKIKNENTGSITLTSIPSCQLISSQFSDLFRIHLDQDNHVYEVDYFATTSDCSPFSSTLPTKDFNTSVSVSRAHDGPKPVIGNFQQVNKKTAAKPVAGQDQEGEGMKEPEEEKSFFQKYWYLLLGAGFLLMSNLAPPEEQGNNGGNSNARRS
ncbi:hypothetical protein DM01DRAFT_1408206 [Hesseltinella vesiculosa]|uniref:Uncharacterized protein n=1 Tax=Hesseltinella vesiculosa TaxID=101127 RepID=A0A1X2GEX5_9FUNG|nr:hypothetical protein DM01DRAFT_1408206 [Hesseltinella vesiculosa]